MTQFRNQMQRNFMCTSSDTNGAAMSPANIQILMDTTVLVVSIFAVLLVNS